MKLTFSRLHGDTWNRGEEAVSPKYPSCLFLIPQELVILAFLVNIRLFSV